VKSLLRRPVVHQAVDYAVGFALASAAVRSGDQAILAVAAVIVIASTAMFDGPLAAFRVFPPNAHRVVDVALSIAGVAVAVTMDIGAATRLSLLGAAAVLTFMSVRFTHGIRETRT
jgi:hypothetical protein